MMKRAFRIALVCTVALSVLACPFPRPIRGSEYTVEITGLQSVDPRGDSLNDYDAAAGSAIIGIGNIGPVVWLDGALQPVEHSLNLGLLHGMNNRGAVAGTELVTGPGTFFPFVSFVDAAAPAAQTQFAGQIYSINELNEYVGTLNNFAALGLVNGDFSLFEGEEGDFANAYDINDRGDFVGSTNNSNAGAILAVKWLRGELTLLDSLGGPFSEAYAINNHGMAVGASTFSPPSGKTTEPHRAVCWPDTRIVELPDLGGSESTAWDINGAGVAVGFALNENEESRAVLWSAPDRSGSIRVTDLNDVVDLGDLETGSLILLEAVDINEVGTILCRADRVNGDSMEQVYVLLRRD